jgi:hypothetical protein
MKAQEYFPSEMPSAAHGRPQPRPVVPPIRAEIGMVACSRCLRVQRGSSWIEAEEIIRELRTYELVDPPRLRPGLCDYCAAALAVARTARAHPLAA